MKKVLVVIGLLVASSSMAVGQQPGGWIVYRSTEGQYAVSLPAQPKVTSQESESAEGEKLQQYLATTVEPGDVVYMVGYFDIRPKMTFSMDVARDSMVESFNGTLISETAMDVAGYPGRDVKLLARIPVPPAEPGQKAPEPASYVGQIRFCVTGTRVYVIQLLFPKLLESDELRAKATRYFDSFRVVKN